MNSEHCLEVAEAVRFGRGVTKDPAAVAKLNHLQCISTGRAIFVNACVAYAEQLEEGDGVPADYAEAKRWYSKGCPELGPACAGLARLARKGLGGPKDMKRANDFATQACNAHAIPSCSELAEQELLKGPKERASAVAHLRADCSRRLTRACDRLKQIGEKP